MIYKATHGGWWNRKSHIMWLHWLRLIATFGLMSLSCFFQLPFYSLCSFAYFLARSSVHLLCMCVSAIESVCTCTLFACLFLLHNNFFFFGFCSFASSYFHWNIHVQTVIIQKVSDSKRETKKKSPKLSMNGHLTVIRVHDDCDNAPVSKNGMNATFDYVWQSKDAWYLSTCKLHI